MSFFPLETDHDLQRAVEASFDAPVVLFKHSITCPISAAAQSAINRLDAPDSPSVYRLVVQQSRVLSNAIAQQFGVRHESPQVLVLVDGQVAAHASHYRITADWLRGEIETLENEP